jgi:diamine N-acetyltransferase
MSYSPSTSEDLPAPNAEVTLREITRETVRSICNLKVAPEQERFVATVAISIAEAHFEPEHAWFRAIYAGATPVGFLQLWDDPVEPDYYLWRFLIDHRYQGRGYGRRALALLVDHVRTRPNARVLRLSYEPGEGSPADFYHKLGFVDTGEVMDGELVSVLDLAQANF